MRSLTRLRHVAALAAWALLAAPAPRALAQARPASAQAPYYPPPGDAWEHRTPEQAGLSAKAVQDAVAIALAAESTSPRDLLENHRNTFGKEPFGEAIGPFRTRGGASGLIIRNGYIVAEWGDPDRVDQTYSVTKSFVTTTVGLAYDRKMIKSLSDPVYKYMVPIVALRGAPSGVAPLVPVPPNMAGAGATTDVPPPRGVAFNAFDVLEPFETEHNRRITWDHLLRQTSTGRARSGESPTGPTARKATSSNGSCGRATSPAPSTRTMTCA